MSQPKRPKWSLKSTFLYLCAAVLLVVPLIVFLFDGSIWARLELATTVLAVGLFLFLSHVLYHGLRFEGDRRFSLIRRRANSADFTSYFACDSFVGLFSTLGEVGGLAGLLIGFLLDVIVSLLLSLLVAALFWLGTNVLIVSISALLLPLYLIFRRFLMYVVWYGRSSRGRLGKSFFAAACYTAASTLWLYAVLFFGHFLAKAAT